MTLVEIYRQDIAGLPVKESDQRRSLWHETVKRYLSAGQMTSDPLRPIKADADGITTVPRKAVFINRPNAYQEMCELYRVTKKRSASPAN